MAAFSFYFVSAESLQSAQVRSARVKCCRLFWCYNRHGSTVVIHALFYAEQILFLRNKQTILRDEHPSHLDRCFWSVQHGIDLDSKNLGLSAAGGLLVTGMSPRCCATTNQTQSFPLGIRDAYARNGPAEPLHPNPFLRSPSIVLLRRLTV